MGDIGVSLSEIVEVRGGALSDEELLALIIIGCEVLGKTPAGVFSPEQVILHTDGVLQIKVVPTNEVPTQYVPPEMLEGNTDVDAGAVHVFCLGEVIRFAGAAEFGNADLFSLLNVMTVAHVATRPSITRLGQMAKNKLAIQNPRALLAEMYTLVMGDEADDFDDFESSSGEYVLNAVGENGELKLNWLALTRDELKSSESEGELRPTGSNLEDTSQEWQTKFSGEENPSEEQKESSLSSSESKIANSALIVSDVTTLPAQTADTSVISDERRKEKQRRLLLNKNGMLSGETMSNETEEEKRSPRKKPTAWNEVESFHSSSYDFGDDIVEYKNVEDEEKEVEEEVCNENLKSDFSSVIKQNHQLQQDYQTEECQSLQSRNATLDNVPEWNTSHASLSPISEANEAFDKLEDGQSTSDRDLKVEEKIANEMTIPEYDDLSSTELKEIPSNKIQKSNLKDSNETFDAEEKNGESSMPAQTFSRRNSLLPNRISGRKPSMRHARHKSKAEPEFSTNVNAPSVCLKAPAMRKKKVTLHRVEHTDVTVELLNGRHVEVSCRSDAVAAEIADVVMRHMNFNENSFFGLTILKGGEHFFLDDHQRLEKFAPPGWKNSRQQLARRIFKLYLRFRYYPASVNFIKTDVVLHELYLQLRRDILDERLQPKREVAMELAALALQAEFLDKPNVPIKDYFSLEHYVSKRFVDSFDEEETINCIVELHGKYQGLQNREAENRFIVLCQRMPDYGAHIHRVFTSKPSTNLGNTPFGDPETGVAQWIGILSRGIVQFEEQSGYRHAVNEHLWQNTQTLQFDKKRFVIVSEVHEPPRSVFFTDHYTKSAYFVRFAASQHRFMIKMRQWNHTLRQNSPFQSNKIPDVGADFSIDSSTPFNYPTLASSTQSPNAMSAASVDSSRDAGSVTPPNESLKSAANGLFEGNREQDTIQEDTVENGEGYTLEVVLNKDPKIGLGLTLVDGNLNGIKGVYVKSVTENGAGKVGGVIVGDRLMSVNGVSLTGKDRHATVDLVRKSDSVVRLKLFRLEAISSALTTNEKPHKENGDKMDGTILLHPSTGNRIAPQARSRTPPPVRKSTNIAKKRVRAVSDFGAVGDTLPELNSEDLLSNLREDSKLRLRSPIQNVNGDEENGPGYTLPVTSMYKFDGVEDDIEQIPKRFMSSGSKFSSSYVADDTHWPTRTNGGIHAQNDPMNDTKLGQNTRSKQNLDWTDDLNDASDSPINDSNYVTLERNESGSLGFQIASSGGLVYVKQITAEPALSCPNIQIGDRIVSVNGEKIHNLSHQQVVDLLRNGGKTVVLGFHQSDFGALCDETVEDSVCVLLEKSQTGSLGLSLAKKTGYDGIYIRMISSGSTADTDGTLRVGDKIWKVNGQLVNDCTPGAIVDMLKAASSPVEIVVKRASNK